MAIGISAGAGYVVAALLGAKWQAAQPLIYVLAFMCLFSPFSWVCSSALMARGFVRSNFLANLLASSIKVSILSAVVMTTGTIMHMALASVAIIVLEAALYVCFLGKNGFVNFRAVCGAWVRIVAAGALALIAAGYTGLAWQPVQAATLPALLSGALLAVVVVGVFVLADLAAWQSMRRPEGPESRLIGIARGFVIPLLPRFQRRWRGGQV